jgi:hypothetical protein
LYALHIHEKISTELPLQLHYKLSLDGTARGQDSDNTASMAGNCNGALLGILQAKEFVNFVPRMTHSLNPAGVNVASLNNASLSFFGIVQRIFALLSCSISRWEILMNTFQTSFVGHIGVLK